LGPPMITDFPAHITNIGFEYDPVVYAPLYWGNPLSLLNALAAFELVHGNYLTPNSASGEPMAYGYTDAELAEQLDETQHPENFRHDSEGNTYVMIPAKSLPIVDLVMSIVPGPLQPVVKPLADLVSPVLKVLIDLGYDWSGDPGQKRVLSLLPFNPLTNWATVGVKLAVATAQGIQAFIGDLGGLSPLAPSTPAPLTTKNDVSTLALRSAAAATESTVTEQDSDAKTLELPTLKLPKLKLVKNSDTDEQNAAEVKQGASDTPTEIKKDETSTPSHPPATKPDETTTPDKTTKADQTASSGATVGHKKDEVHRDGKKAGDKKADDTGKKDTAKKTSDNDKKSDTDKKDAHSAKAAA
jgi:hypothetical protein